MGFDPTNQYGFLGAGTIAHDTCATPFTRDSTTAIRGRTCYFTDHNSTFLTCEGNAPDGSPHRPTTVERVNGEIVRTPGTCVGRGSGDTEVWDVGFFVRDRFTIGDHWTMNLGLRAETWAAQGYDPAARPAQLNREALEMADFFQRPRQIRASIPPFPPCCRAGRAAVQSFPGVGFCCPMGPTA